MSPTDAEQRPLQAAPQFPWREGNHFRLLADGDAFFPAMLETIDRARHHVLLEIYLVTSGWVAGRFIDALVGAAERGCAVYLLLDDFGCRGLHGRDRGRLRHANIHLAWHNPLRLARFRRYLARDHRKLLLVDGEVAFTGGFGLTDDFDPPLHAESRWRDTAVEIRGPVVADWHRLFCDLWHHWSDQPLPAQPLPARAPAGDARGAVRPSQGLRGGALTRSLLLAVLRSRQRVWIATAYFIPSRRLRRSLRRLARRGVDVRLLLPGPVTDHPGVRRASQRYYAGLLRHGVRIFEYQPRFMHSKLVLCDQWVSVGSSNFDRWNLRRNLEANQECQHPLVADAARALFETDFQQAREIRQGAWRGRGWWQRLREWLWSRVEVLLDKDD